MKRLAALALCALVAALPARAADIDERWVRAGAESAFSLGYLKAAVGIEPFHRSIAVVIGVGDYTNGWNPLEAPARDVRRMADFLKGQGAFDIVHTLTDGAATRERIRTLMVEELPREVGPNDRVLFYFSGHGTQRKLFGDRVLGYLALAGSAPEGYSSMIDMGALENWWYGIAHARQSLFILDACFSGLGLQSKGDAMRDRTIADLSKRGHHLITAGTEDQQSYANLRKWGGSLFTTALIDGMKGRADSQTVDAPRDGIVSLKELWDYTTKRIRAEVPSGDMTPQQAGFEVTSEGEFFFVADPDALKTVTVGGGTEEAKGTPVTLAPAPEPKRTVSLAEKRFAKGRKAWANGNSAAAVRYYKLAIAADVAHSGARAELANLYAAGNVNGKPDFAKALALLEPCKTAECKAIRDSIQAVQTAPIVESIKKFPWSK